MRESYSQGLHCLLGGLILLPAAAAALEEGDSEREVAVTEDKRGPAAQHDFSSIDENSDQALEWQEIRAAHGAVLKVRGWDKGYILDTFDHNHDGYLNEEEHRALVVSMDIGDPSAAPTALGAEPEAADSHISRSTPEVVSNPQEDANLTRATGNGDSEEEPRSARPTVYDLSIENLQGRTVVNANNQKLGKVEQVVVNPRSSELGLVVTSGGFLGIGGSEVVVEVSQLGVSPERKLVWRTDKNEAQVREMAAYQEEDYLPVAAEDYTNLAAVKEELLSTARKEQSPPP